MTEQSEVPVKKKNNVATKIVVWIVLIVVAVIAYFVLAAVLPLWWADVIRNQVGGNLGAGILVGMFYGFVFTFVPLLVAWQATHRRVSWPLKIVILVIAVALAVPNLLTLAIMNGTNEASHNAQRIIGTDATWFPTWSLVSAIAAAVVFLVLLIVWTAWRRRGRKMKELKRHNELARMAAEQAEKDHAAALKEAERQNVISRRIASSEEDRRHEAEAELRAREHPEGGPEASSGRHAAPSDDRPDEGSKA